MRTKARLADSRGFAHGFIPLESRPNRRAVPCRGGLAALVLVLAAVWLPAAGQPAVKGDLSEKRSDLKDVQGRIHELQRQITKSEESRDNAADALQETEQGISLAQRRLRELSSTRAAAESQLAQLQEQNLKLESRMKTQQAGLEKLLSRYYIGGQAQGLRHMLSGSDPNQIARDLYYLKELSRSEADMIGALRTSLHEQQQLTESARAKRDELAAIEREREAELTQLAEQQKKRKAVLAEMSEQIKGQRKEVANLKRDEQRLTRLIDGLAEIARKQAAAAERARRQALAEQARREREALLAKNQAKQAAESDVAAGAAESASPAKAEEPSRPAPVIARIDETPEALSGSVAFSSLRGRLRLPVRGELMNRFGTPRAEGGTSWRGVFIRAEAGAEVKAVAAGRIVYADWLRGFGNLVIVDHGDGYLSIYGYNESLFHSAGQVVKSGDAIASVGSSGGSSESGLYFELRHRGEPFDPLRWVGVR